MGQSFDLKQYGGLTIFEQNQLTAEERKWWIKRLNEDIEKRNKSSSSTPPPGHRDHTPGLPPI